MDNLNYFLFIFLYMLTIVCCEKYIECLSLLYNFKTMYYGMYFKKPRESN